MPETWTHAFVALDFGFGTGGTGDQPGDQSRVKVGSIASFSVQLYYMAL